MKEQAEVLDGKLKIASGEGKGTRLQLKVPL
jgi:signal transduction histidine kinase